MRSCLILVIAMIFAACEKSEIKPMFPKKSLAQIHGDGEVMTFKIKVPLSQDTVGSYDASEVLSDASIDQENTGLLRRFWNGIKYSVYDTAVNLGISNRIKYSFDYEFPQIDSKYIKAVKINRIFFALENCRQVDEDCMLKEKSNSPSFKFLDQFFLNISLIAPGESLDFENQHPFIDEASFSLAAKKAFEQPAEEEAFQDITLARFDNSRSYQRSNEVADSLGKIFLLRMRDDLSKGDKVELIRHLKSPHYRGVIKDFSMVGHNIYLELEEYSERKDFFLALRDGVGSVEQLGIDSFEACTQANCANLTTNDFNLVPLLAKSNHIRFDTFLALKELEMNDFKYNGFIELEVKLNFGI